MKIGFTTLTGHKSYSRMQKLQMGTKFGIQYLIRPEKMLGMKGVLFTRLINVDAREVSHL